MVYANKPQYNIERENATAWADLCLKIVKNWVQPLDFWSVPVLAMQKKSSFIQNAIERTFTEITSFIDIQNRFCFI